MTKLNIDTELIRKLADLLEETGLTEIEWAENGCHVRVSQTSTTQAQPIPLGIKDGDVRDDNPPAQLHDSDSIAPGAIVSPMVGTVYLAPEPGQAPFVEVGAKVIEGQTLFIVEAMKTMNPVPATMSGTVKHIAVTDGSPVEYGELLLILE